MEDIPIFYVLSIVLFASMDSYSIPISFITRDDSQYVQDKVFDGARINSPNNLQHSKLSFGNVQNSIKLKVIYKVEKN